MTKILWILWFLAASVASASGLNGNAIAEFQEMTRVREMLTPSVYHLKMSFFLTRTNSKGEPEKQQCAESFGTAFMVTKNGYLATNAHVVDPEEGMNECLKNVRRHADKSKIPFSSFFTLRFDVKYTLIDWQKKEFPFTVVKQWWPDSDIAIIKIPEPLPAKNAAVFDLLFDHRYDFTPVAFRAGSPKIVDGKVVSGKGPMTLPDEPIVMMGMPLQLPYTLTKGTLGNGAFFAKKSNGDKETLIHFIAPIQHGNSGGPVISLLDFKVIGMATMAKNDGNASSQMAGATPFWVIQEKIKELGLF